MDNNYNNDGYNSYDNNDGYTTDNSSQAFSGIDNNYYDSSSNTDFVPPMAEENKNPGCLTSILGFFLTIILSIALITGVTIVAAGTSIGGVIDASVALMKETVYEALSEEPVFEEAMDLMENELSDMIPEEVFEEIGDSMIELVDSALTGESPDIDYEKISDGIYDVGEEAVVLTLDYYVESLETGELSKKGQVMDEFVSSVLGYDLWNSFYDATKDYDTNNLSSSDIEAIRNEAYENAMSEIKVEIDDMVYNELKTEIDDLFENLVSDPEIKQAYAMLKLIPTIAIGCFIASAIIILIMLLMYKQRYRAIRNTSVAVFFTAGWAGLITVLMKAVFTTANSEMEKDEKIFLDAFSDGLMPPLYTITGILIAAFVLLTVLQIVMKKLTRCVYRSY